jgi:chemotaxis protein histidine kinase CheA
MNERIGRVQACPVHDVAALQREVHTVKGMASMYGLGSIVDACHALEENAADYDEPTMRAATASIVDRWRELAEHLRPFATERDSSIEVSHEELDSLVHRLASLPGGSAIAAEVAGWRHEPVRARLERLASHIRALSSKLGKQPLNVSIEADHTRTPPETWNQIGAALVHVVRNAVDHGLESPAERKANGKPAEATIYLRARTKTRGLEIEVEDCGRGIDWQRVAASARAAGLACESHEDLERALFSDGVTTRDAVTTISGRGVGLAAARTACLEAGGSVHVDSRLGAGTRFTFVLPSM